MLVLSRRLVNEMTLPSDFKDNQQTLMNDMRTNDTDTGIYSELEWLHQRIQEASRDTILANEKVEMIQFEHTKLKKKCFKLQTKLQERDATIKSLQNQFTAHFPVLMNETWKSIHSALGDYKEDNQSDISSVLTMDGHQRLQDHEDMEMRLHQYELQVEQLHHEIQEEKQQSAMLLERNKELKSMESKLKKAYKYAKKQIDSLQNNGMKEMLQDMETKYRGQIRLNDSLENELDMSKSECEQLRHEKAVLHSRIEGQSDMNELLKGECNDLKHEIQRLQQIIRDQKLALENVAFDGASLDLSDTQLNRQRIGNQQNISESIIEVQTKLLRGRQREREIIDKMQQTIDSLITENEHLRQDMIQDQSLEKQNITQSISEENISQDQMHTLVEQMDKFQAQLQSLYQLAYQCVTTNQVDWKMMQQKEPNYINFANFTLSIDTFYSKMKTNMDISTDTLNKLETLLDDTIAQAAGQACALQ